MIFSLQSLTNVLYLIFHFYFYLDVFIFCILYFLLENKLK